MGLNPKIIDQGPKVLMEWTPDLSCQGYRLYVDGVAVSRTFKPEASSTTFRKPDDQPHRYGVQRMDVVPALEEVEWPSSEVVIHRMSRLTDVRAGGELTFVANKWNPNGAQGYQLPESTGPAWPNGGGLFEVDTPYGPGLRMKLTAEMDYPAQVTWASVLSRFSWGAPPVHDFLGKHQKWKWHRIFPRADNPNGFSTTEWVACEDFTLVTDGSVGHALAIAPEQRWRFAYLDGVSTHKVAYGPALVYDHWYDMEVEILWSEGPDGILKVTTDGDTWLDHRGRTQWTRCWTVYNTMRVAKSAPHPNGSTWANLRLIEL